MGLNEVYENTELYKELIVWRQSHQFVLQIYRLTETFPKHELYGIISQLRRAAVSVPTNIVEGYARKSRLDFLRFLDISRASLLECAYLLELSKDLKYLTDDQYKNIDQLRAKTGFLLRRYVISIQNRQPNPLQPLPPSPPSQPKTA